MLNDISSVSSFTKASLRIFENESNDVHMNDSWKNSFIPLAFIQNTRCKYFKFNMIMR